ncbi:MAG: hypothetical protein A2Z04_06265 [Chloroflexi bacterium RBG_16_57_9]|nr:MAG: hypothetical protein A2Z04_06265 [Chloroflexi bacterium RBG_16_57_9]
MTIIAHREYTRLKDVFAAMLTRLVGKVAAYAGDGRRVGLEHFVVKMVVKAGHFDSGLVTLLTIGVWKWLARPGGLVILAQGIPERIAHTELVKCFKPGDRPYTPMTTNAADAVLDLSMIGRQVFPFATDQRALIVRQLRLGMARRAKTSPLFKIKAHSRGRDTQH